MTSHPGHNCHPSKNAVPVCVDGVHIELWCAGCGMWLGGCHTPPDPNQPTMRDVLDVWCRIVVDYLCERYALTLEDAQIVARIARRKAELFIATADPAMADQQDTTGMRRLFVFAAEDVRWLGTASYPNDRQELVIGPALWRRAVNLLYPDGRPNIIRWVAGWIEGEES